MNFTIRGVTYVTRLNNTALNTVFYNELDGLDRPVLSETVYTVHGFCNAMNIM